MIVFVGGGKNRWALVTPHRTEFQRSGTDPPFGSCTFCPNIRTLHAFGVHALHAFLAGVHALHAFGVHALHAFLAGVHALHAFGVHALHAFLAGVHALHAFGVHALHAFFQAHEAAAPLALPHNSPKTNPIRAKPPPGNHGTFEKSPTKPPPGLTARLMYRSSAPPHRRQKTTMVVSHTPAGIDTPGRRLTSIPPRRDLQRRLNPKHQHGGGRPRQATRPRPTGPTGQSSVIPPNR